jgi:hypothetical protein
MNDREMVWTIVILAAAYYVFVIRKQSSRRLRGRFTTGYSGTYGGGASKKPTRYANSNPRTNAHQGARYSAAPTTSNGATGPGAENVGGTKKRGWRSGMTTGAAGSLISNQWPTRWVSSTGSRRIASNVTQVPSYTTVPLTVQGIGGGGSIVAST